MDRDEILAELEDPAATPERVTAALAAIADAPRVELRIDITDPPTPPRAFVGDIEATGKTADDAVLELGALVATQIREVASEANAKLEQTLNTENARQAMPLLFDPSASADQEP